LDADAQMWLARILRSRSFTPQGATEAQRLDLRLICGSATDLRLAVADGTFRAELYHAIAVGTLDRCPRSAQRHDDIPLLAQHMLFEAAARTASRCAA
jgi:two-component system response regulator HupR/HoxA